MPEPTHQLHDAGDGMWPKLSVVTGQSISPTFRHARWLPRDNDRPPPSALRAGLPGLPFRRPRRPAREHQLKPGRSVVGCGRFSYAHTRAAGAVVGAASFPAGQQRTPPPGLERIAESASQSRGCHRAAPFNGGECPGSAEEAEAHQAQPGCQGRETGSQAPEIIDQAASPCSHSGRLRRKALTTADSRAACAPGHSTRTPRGDTVRRGPVWYQTPPDSKK
jgi:hypothetical protein